MKRITIIYILAAMLVLVNGCEYHPLYDGQKLCVYDKYSGIIETDDKHIYLPEGDKLPYVLEIYGGEGKDHSIEIADPDILDWEYAGSKVVNPPMMDSEVIPATISLFPLKRGDTTLTLRDDDTGESISVHVHVCQAYHAFKILDGQSRFGKGTVFSFRYGGSDNVLIIGRMGADNRDVEVIVEGRYEFVSIEERLFMEICFPADKFGLMDPDGTELFRRFAIQFSSGQSYSADLMLDRMNLGVISPVTKAVKDDISYDDWFLFRDVTDFDLSSPEWPEGQHFYVGTAWLIPDVALKY